VKTIEDKTPREATALTREVFLKPQTVAHFLDTQSFGGCEEVVFQLIEAINKDHWRPILIHHDAPGIQRLVDEVNRIGVETRVFPRITEHNKLKTLYLYVRSLRQMRPTVFHAHLNWPLACRYGLGAARLAGVSPIVATSHLYVPLPATWSARIRQRLQRAVIDHYVAVSAEVKARLCRELGLRDGMVSVVHNGIRQAPFERAADPAIRVSLAVDPTTPLVLTPARLHMQKGHEYLINAIPSIPKAVFVFAGDGPEKSALEALADRLRVRSRIRFLGERNDVPDLLASCDLFVLPSLYEGLPISVLEAMAASKPVIATRTGGTDEAVVHQETGLLVAPRNAHELATAVRALLDDPSLASRLATAGRERAISKFSSKAMAEGVTRVYDDLLRRRAAYRSSAEPG
jgi:glycosyltransferase involved in cell wall biosynthesis